MSEEVKPEESVEDVKKKLQAFFRENFPTPAHLLAWIDEDLAEGKYELYRWQARAHNDLFHLNIPYTSAQPLELALRAVNGSGKDRMVIAPLVLHMIVCNPSARVVITSSSGRQLATQTEAYISRFGNALNRKLSKTFNLSNDYEFLTVQQRKIVCNFTDSELLLFATDEESKAEGYHPIGTNTLFALIINEAKSIPDNIYEALSRCNGFTHWIEISSPGKPDGKFYRSCTSTRTNSSGKEAVVKYVVRAMDCPHLGGEEYVKRLVEIYGSRDHYMVRSMVDAEFSHADEQVVISYDKYNRLIQFQQHTAHLPDKTRAAGLDLSFGGDEICLQVRDGNRHIGCRTFKSNVTRDICNKIDSWIKEFHLQGCPIYADAGGLGEPIISLLRTDYGYRNIIAIKNQWRADNGVAYANLGTEMWFNLNQLIERQEIIIQDEDTLRKQLCNRYYKLNKDNSAQLESKQEAKAKSKARGGSSPDRADALALCFHRYSTPSFKKERTERILKFRELLGKITTPQVPTIRRLLGIDSKESVNLKHIKDSGIKLAISRTSKHEKQELRLEIQQTLNNLFGRN